MSRLDLQIFLMEVIMKKLLYSLISIWFCLGSTVLAQNPEWITYNTSNSGLPDNSVGSIAIDGSGNKWIDTREGLVKFDGSNWTVYNSTNSGLPDNYIRALAIDGSDNKWIGADSKLAKFNDTIWTIYTVTNSGLPGVFVRCIGIDKFDNKWIGTSQGLAKFDGTNWTIFKTINSGLPSDNIRCIEIDKFGNKWIWASDFVKYDDTTWTVYNIPSPTGYLGYIGCITTDNTGNKWIGVFRDEPMGWYGLIKYDDETFTYYTESDSGVTLGSIQCIAIDEFDNKWIGTYWPNGGGLVKFDGLTWNVYNTTNSGLPSNHVNCIEIDKLGNKWIGTDSGLTVFNEGGIVPVELNSFTATANGKEVTLNWSTATELNNQGFEVQRKFGSNDFVTVGSVKGYGTTTSPNQYSYVDKLIDPGKYFYRLKQIDFNGTFEYSDVIEVEVRSVDKFALEQNYPNPFNPTTTIGYILQEKSNAKLTLLNAIGEEIAVLVNKEQDKGYHKVEFDAANLSSGVYFYQLKAGSYVETKKMILLR